MREPKTQHLTQNAKVQFVLVEDQQLAQFAAERMRMWVGYNEPLWKGAASFLGEWRAALADLGVHDNAFMPSGLRAGGATEHFRRSRDIPQPCDVGVGGQSSGSSSAMSKRRPPTQRATASPT